jgi:hypothetical protein
MLVAASSRRTSFGSASSRRCAIGGRRHGTKAPCFNLSISATLISALGYESAMTDPSVDVQLKRQNTLRFLDHVENGRGGLRT